MLPDDLKYTSLAKLLGPYSIKGRAESAAFLKWFLENIYRLDDTTADDSICDKTNDKGIDGIYVDHTTEEVHFLQIKIAQKDAGTIGDKEPKNLVGSVEQFANSEAIKSIVEGNANDDLKKLINRQEIGTLVDKGYKRVPVFISNQTKDKDTTALEKAIPGLLIYDRERIATDFVDFDAGEGVDASFTIDTGYVKPLHFQVSKEVDLYFALVDAISLVKLSGIADATLFKKNIRLSLGNTPVNKAISESVDAKPEHRNFPLFHNGITILCASVKPTEHDLTISNYVVVNGAQSLTSFYNRRDKLSPELRVC